MWCTTCNRESSTRDRCYWCGSDIILEKADEPAIQVQVDAPVQEGQLVYSETKDYQPQHIDIDLGKKMGLRIRAQNGVRDCQIELQNDDGTWSRIPGMQRLVLILDVNRVPQLRITKVVI